MNPLPLRIGVASLLFTVAACTSETGTMDSNSADATRASTAVSRELSPQVAVPTDLPIGKTMDSIAAELSQGLVKGRTVSTEECVTQAFLKDGKEVFHRETCKDHDVIRVGYRGPQDFERLYGDHANRDHDKDGKVDNYFQSEGSSAEDQNRDGKVDLQIFVADPETDLLAFGRCSLSENGKLANRILTDTNFDGKFDQESLTGKSSARTIISCEE